MNDIEGLPIFKGFNEIKSALNDSVNLTLKSPTGSGKSIGLPLLLLNENFINGQILVVQPRRIAARFLAQRVAQITKTQVGDIIGYQVRFDDKTSVNTKIIYLTDGLLLRKILSDKLLSRVGLVIFDEFHERSIQMDVALALLRKIQESHRPSLRIIITSATLEIGGINKYLGNSNSVQLTAREYPVEIEYKSPQQGENIWKKIGSEIKKCISKYDGDILIFASGAYEISKIINEINANPWSKDFIIRPLFGNMSIGDQELALKSSIQRKIIVSTNIAETSLTVEGVRIVIDTGIAKKSSYDPMRGINVLLPQPISKSSACQRSGRAGRIASGYCIRLWGEKEHSTRDEMEVPAIERLDLTEIYLNLCDLGVDPSVLSWLTPPPVKSLESAKKSLLSIGAITPSSEITKRGHMISQFPLNPRLGSALLLSKELDCLPALALSLALVEDRSPIIHKDFNADIVESFLSNLQVENQFDAGSDLRLLLGAWAYAKSEGFSVDRCKYVGIHASRCKEAEKLALRFCNIAGIQEFSFQFPKFRDLSKVMIVAFPNHLARIKNRGTLLFENIEGFKVHVGKYSEVQNADWVVGLNIVEKPFKGKIGLEMEYLTEVDNQLIKKVLSTKIKRREEVALHPDTRMVIKRKYNQLGVIKFDIEEYESPSKEDMQKAYSKELKSGNLNLKKWDIQVQRFIARISFITKNYPEYGITNFDEDSKSILFDEICRDAKSWKEIRNRDVLPILIQLYTVEEVDLLNRAVPATIPFGNKNRNYKLDYRDSTVSIRVRIQDLYDITKHPHIVFEKHPVVLEILAPNDRCVQVTENISEFWDGSYLRIRKDLAGRYPKHEWR
jgi:ATP-dependent helicase HrpB